MTTFIAWALMVASLVGFAASFPMWLSKKVSDRTIFGITFVLSWAALWFTAYIAIVQASK